MNDDEFLTAFDAGTVPNETFHHRDHVRIVRLALQREPALRALERVMDGLKRLAAASGKPGLYHETITLAYLFLIHERMALQDPHEPWDTFVEKNADLFAFRPGILERYYRTETLASPLARRIFVLPDRALER